MQQVKREILNFLKNHTYQKQDALSPEATNE